MEKGLIKADLMQATKMGCAMKRMNMGELAKMTGRSGSTLSGILKRGTPTLKVALDILEGAGAKMIVRYEDGQEVELVVEQ